MSDASTLHVDRVVELLERIATELACVRAAQAERAGPPSPLLSREQLAALLQIKARTLRRLVLMGEIPAPITIGGSIRWRRSDIERWLAERSAA